MALALEKKVEKVKLRLAKLGVPETLIAQVKFMLDCSGSTESPNRFYSSGQMQELTDRLLAVGMRFDDNQSIEMYAFSDVAVKLEDVTANDFGNYIQQQFIPQAKNAGVWMRGTDWASAARLYLNELNTPQNPVQAPEPEKKGFLGNLFGKKPQPEQPAPAAPAASTNKVIPSYIAFVTDGENYGSTPDFARIIQNTPQAYWMLVGVGNKSMFGELEALADKYSNVGFVNFADLRSQDDDQLYASLLTQEAADFLKKFA